MNKKTINHILLIFVICIWGLLLYNLFNGMFFSPNKIVSNQIAKSNLTLPQKLTKDTILLKQLQRDPFLDIYENKLPERRVNKVAKNKLAKKNLPKRVDNVKWPQIKYLGYIMDSKSKEPLIIIKIENKIYRKKLHQVIVENLQISSFLSDSIKIKFNGEEKIFKKN
ncbi:MAG: hypothetical protein Q8P20_03805 [bacterium]|nr:hypothetical protein [bacterium]